MGLTKKGTYITDSNLNQAAIISLGEISRNGHLIYEDKESIMSVVECLHKLLLTSQVTNKIKERSASTLGFMCLHQVVIMPGDVAEATTLDLSQIVMQKLLDSSQAKQIELHMAIGEALVNCALGSRSDSLQNPWTTNHGEIG